MNHHMNRGAKNQPFATISLSLKALLHEIGFFIRKQGGFYIKLKHLLFTVNAQMVRFTKNKSIYFKENL